MIGEASFRIDSSEHLSIDDELADRLLKVGDQRGTAEGLHLDGDPVAALRGGQEMLDAQIDEGVALAPLHMERIVGYLPALLGQSAPERVMVDIARRHGPTPCARELYGRRRADNQG
jgi:hypothetical protein